jgi:hypothetical protein
MSKINIVDVFNPLFGLVDSYKQAKGDASETLKAILHGAHKVVYPIYSADIEEQEAFRDDLVEFGEKRRVTFGERDSVERVMIKILLPERSSNRQGLYTNILLRAKHEEWVPDTFEDKLNTFGIEKAGKPSLTVKKEPVDNGRKGRKILAEAVPMVSFQSTEHMPRTQGRFVALCNSRRDGTIEVVAYTEDEKAISSLVTKVGTGQVKVVESLNGEAKENQLDKLKDTVFDSFEVLPNYTGEVSGEIIKVHKPTGLSDFIFPTEKSELQFDMWCKKSSSQVLFFEGSHGTGKTTLTDLAPTLLYPNVKCDIREVSLNQPLNKLTEQVKKLREDAPWLNSQMPVFITFNEAQALMEKGKDLSLLRPLLEQQANNVHIIMTSNKAVVDTGINSRAVNIHLGKYDATKWQPRLLEILKLEGIKCNDAKSMLGLTKLIGGDVRELLKAFDELVYRFNVANPKSIKVKGSLAAPAKNVS